MNFFPRHNSDAESFFPQTNRMEKFNKNLIYRCDSIILMQHKNFLFFQSVIIASKFRILDKMLIMLMKLQ